MGVGEYSNVYCCALLQYTANLSCGIRLSNLTGRFQNGFRQDDLVTEVCATWPLSLSCDIH